MKENQIKKNSSIKGKLQNLEKEVLTILGDLGNQREEVNTLKAMKDVLQDDLKRKTTHVKEDLSIDLEKVEKEMKLHFNKQKEENLELQKKLSELKTKKTVLQNQLIGNIE